jgi:hypothetical protein
LADETPEVDLRGEISIPLEGREYGLRPSFDAIKRIERLTGKNHEHLAQQAIQQNLTYEDMGIICAEMMREYGKANPDDPLKSSYLGAKAEKLEKMIFEEGKPKIGVRLAVVLTAALSGGYTASGEAKATEI